MSLMVDAGLTAAILDNARWCHLVCATHGIAGTFDEDAWVSGTRTPPMYPDAVTLTDDVSAEALLGRLDTGPGCSIKDSFSTLDLAPAGFKVLFDARWLWRAAGPPTASAERWERVERPDDLAAWSREHGGGSTFSAALLDDRSVTILAARDRGRRLMAGAVATEGESAVGISNVFGVGATAPFAEAFASATAAIVGRFPDRPVVGYLSMDRLGAAHDAGFETIGPLRVWLLEGDG
ncbi:MAG: hypothetical protein ACJ765_14445 [Chloroflexota bacterium]